MVVDDDHAIRETLQVVLEETGYQPICVENGQEALKRLRDGSPAPCVILLDLMMPVMSGQEFLRVRHQDPALARVPTVVVTAGGDLPAEVPVLKKPVSLDTILSVIERHCMGNKRAADVHERVLRPRLPDTAARCWGRPSGGRGSSAHACLFWRRRKRAAGARN